MLSIAIPYAGGSRDFLERAIASVRAYVGDFGDDRIGYVRNAGPHGIGAGWNACLALGGDLLTILHADDELEPSYAADMLALAGRHPAAALLFCGASTIDETGAVRFSFRDRFKALIRPRGDEFVLRGLPAVARLCIGNFIMAPTVVYRRSLLADRAFSLDFRFVLDLDFTVETLMRGYAIAGTARSLFRYRRHASQQTAVLDRETARLDEEIAYYRALAERFDANGDRACARLARLRLSTRLGGLTSAVADARAGRFAASEAKLRRSLLP
jgi:hypothetical protein